jgi:two-component SAPR family response regulator
VVLDPADTPPGDADVASAATSPSPAADAESASVPTSPSPAADAESGLTATGASPDAEAQRAAEPSSTTPEAEAGSAAELSRPSPAAESEVSVPPAPAVPPVPMLPLLVGGLGVAGAAGLVFGARRLRRLRPLPHEPESEVVVQGGFAEAQLAHDLTRGLHGVGFDPLAALVAQLEQFLLEYNLSGVEVVALRHGRSSTTITLRCGLAQQALLLDVATAFAEKLEADVEACVSTDQDVVLRLVRLRRTRLLPTADSVHEAPCLVPLGVLYDRQTYAAAWRSLGHVLVVSLPGHGADTILSSLVATLSARRSPEQLRMWIIGAPRALPAPLFELPHLERVVDPADAGALSEAIEQLRKELDRRATQTGALADLLVVVPELASLAEDAESLALLAGRAADVGVRLAVASADPEHVAASPLAQCFATRMVLRMQSEELSVALLGVADAAFLAGGGRLLLRLDGREPVELYGYRVAAEHLERLVKVMRSAYPAPPPEPPLPSKPPPEPPLPAELPPEPPLPAELPPEVPPPAPPSPAHVPDAGERTPERQPPEIEAANPAQAALDRAKPPERASQSASLAPIQVFCFGAPHVLCQGQQVWPHGGGDAKPWELLLFLACQPAEGAPRKMVIDTMWPDAEGMAEDVNHRFRQLRYRLRRQLQQVADAPSSDGVCMDRRGFRLDPAIVYSDVHEFLMLERAARLHPNPTDPEVIERLERVRELYVGDLMDSPDAHRYAWVDERDESGVTLREHFRKLFQNACMRLAEAYASLGRAAEAIEVYHDLTEMDPSDERLFQALFRLRAEAGDEIGLKTEAQRMRQLLRDLSTDVDDAEATPEEPDPETLEEYARLMAGLRERQREPAAV